MNFMTNAELAILGLVAEGPRHGYEIDQIIQVRGMRDWTEVGFSSIYYLLKKLARDGRIEGRLEEAKRGPARRVYHITPGGQQAFYTAVLDVLSVPRHHHSPLQLGLANLPSIPHRDAITALGKYHDALAARLADVQEKQRHQQPLPFFVDAMFEHSTTMIRAELEWLERFTRELEEEYAQG
jgi:DNA-binding PadR family transcriptional regulator